MARKNKAVFGIYRTANEAEQVVSRLMSSGFTADDISVLLPDNPTSRQFAHEKNTKAPEGTTAGATTGGVIGGALGLLAGIGSIAIPGIGPLIAAGPIVATLAGIGAGGTVGGLLGAMVGAGIPEFEAKRYEGRIRDGGILLSVHCDTDADIDRAKDILNRTGAQDVSTAGEAGADYKDTPVSRV